MASAIERPYKKPEQDAAISNEGIACKRSARWIWQAVEGKGISGDVVETIMASTAPGSISAAVQARRAASTAKSDVALPSSTQCRERIPVRA
jgi:hypothetical protein